MAKVMALLPLTMAPEYKQLMVDLMAHTTF
jgi:hypothetical protein